MEVDDTRSGTEIMNPAETIKDWAQRAKQFYYDVRSEMKKVSWPGRQEVVGTTIVVVVAVFFFGIYLFVVDQVVAQGLNWVLRQFGVVAGGGA
jgi:preprotein translocase subunit SecE